jgi:hypothetical protein
MSRSPRLTHHGELLALGNTFLEESLLLLGRLRRLFPLNFGDGLTQFLTRVLMTTNRTSACHDQYTPCRPWPVELSSQLHPAAWPSFAAVLHPGISINLVMLIRRTYGSFA